MTLAELEEQTKASPKPAGLEQTAANLVFGEGDPNANVVFIGEAPGEQEDETGRPFVGRAGQLFDQILDSVNINRDDVYITNIVKYRPPANRNPTPEEIQASEPLLMEQLQLLRPQIVATLGNVPTQYFLSTKEGITKTRGNWFDWHGIKLMPLFHPAYLLRNPSRKKGSPKWLMWQDMQELKRAMDELGDKPSTFNIDTTQQNSLF